MPEKNKQPFVKSLIQSLGEARDAKVGAVGAQQIRDEYARGNDEWAHELAEKLVKSNLTGLTSALGMNAYITTPLFKVGTDSYFGYKGAQNLLSDNGIAKTVRLSKEGNTWGTVKSAAGDALDLTFLGNGLKNVAFPMVKNISGFITAGTEAGRARLQSIADDVYSTMKSRVPEVAEEAGITIRPQDPKLQAAGISPQDVVMGTGPEGRNLVVYADVSNPSVASMFGAKAIPSKINYIFDLRQTRNGKEVAQVGHSGIDGITINRAHFLFPYKDMEGRWQMLNMTGVKASPEFLVGHEGLHRGLNSYTPITSDQRLRLTTMGKDGSPGTNKNYVWYDSPYYDSLKAKEGTHNGILEDWRADVSGMFAERGIPQNTRWADLSNDVQADIIKTIARRRNVNENDVRSITTGLSFDKFLKNGGKLKIQK